MTLQTQSAIRISVIIPTHNRASTLRTTLESLIDQQLDPDTYEVLVVDNRSIDATTEVVRDAQAVSKVAIRYLYEGRPGVHYARNLGALHARGSLLYFTDDDMLATPGMLRELWRLFSLDPLIGTASGQVLPKWQCDPPGWVLAQCQNGLLSLQLRSEELIISGDDMGVYSCHQAIRKAVLVQCGGFNPENTGGTWVGDGETGLNLKVRALGFKFAYSSKAVTYHVIPAERMTQRYLNRRLANQGYADAYTAFRAERPSIEQLLKAQILSLLRCGLESVLTVVRFLMQRHTWRVHRARLSYHYARFGYDGRLRRDAAWREFALRDNWFSEND